MNNLRKETDKCLDELMNIIPSGSQTNISPSGILIFNRATGINVLFDEINPPPHLWSKAPRQVSIALTNACDLSCPHCYASKKTASLELKNIKAWIIELDANGCIGIGLGGGEPTLYPKLLELCSFVSKYTKIALVMTTHGHNLTQNLVDNLANFINFFRISMDGVGSTYESIRGRSFEELLYRINTLRKHAAFGINFLVNKYTLPDLDDALQISADLGASEFLLIPEVNAGQGIEIDKNTFEQLRSWVNNYHGSIQLAISERNTEGMPCCDPFQNEENLMSFAHVDALGVLKSSSYESSGVKIKDSGIMTALGMLNRFSIKEH